MYLHLGDEFIIPYRNIIGIFDLDGVTVTKAGRDFLQTAEREGRLFSITENLPKSFIVCMEGPCEIIYTSPISAATLYRRIERGMESDVALQDTALKEFRR